MAFMLRSSTKKWKPASKVREQEEKKAARAAERKAKTKPTLKKKAKATKTPEGGKQTKAKGKKAKAGGKTKAAKGAKESKPKRDPTLTLRNRLMSWNTLTKFVPGTKAWASLPKLWREGYAVFTPVVVPFGENVRVKQWTVDGFYASEAEAKARLKQLKKQAPQRLRLANMKSEEWHNRDEILYWTYGPDWSGYGKLTEVWEACPRARKSKPDREQERWLKVDHKGWAGDAMEKHFAFVWAEDMEFWRAHAMQLAGRDHLVAGQGG